jgi:beta-lactamase regulating signal transducer with metallopeptidase domain
VSVIGDQASTGVAWLGTWLSASSIALTLSTTAAALWCAYAERSRARVRYAVWCAALALAIVAPLAAKARAAIMDAAAADPVSVALVLPPVAPGVIAVWSIGVLVMLSRIVHQQLALRRWARRFSLADAGSAVGVTSLNEDAVLGPRFALVQGDAGAMPVCWGIVRPRIMLPADAVEWTRELRRVVLRHEVAHIEQRDALSDLLGRVVVALLWFHPAAWLVFARIRIEREQACDERVIDSGIDPVSYGEQLLALARRLRPADAAVAAIADRRNVEARITALLRADGRRHAVGAGAAAAAAIALVALPVFLLTPAHATPRLAAVVPINSEAAHLPGGHPGSFRTSLTGRVR